MTDPTTVNAVLYLLAYQALQSRIAEGQTEQQALVGLAFDLRLHPDAVLGAIQAGQIAYIWRMDRMGMGAPS